MNSSSVPEDARRIVVRGRVQGVYFRASTAARATELGLRGFAQNLPDGTVLVQALGNADSLEKLAAWLRHGPPMARVDTLEATPIDADAVNWPRGFEQR